MIKLKSDLDGKILFIKSKNFKLDYLINKRIFNLINKDEVLFFIDKFYYFINNKFLKKEQINIHIKIFETSLFSKITFIKKNSYVYLFFKKNNTTEFKINKTNLFFTYLFITRFKFITGSINPFLFAVLWSLYNYEYISYINAFIVFIALILFHIIANTYNDYFDWISERDVKNLNYVFNNSGGSRSIDLNLITPKKMLSISYFLTFLVFLIGMYFTITVSLKILIIGIIGFLSLYFYSAPPIHLASRYGAGEFAHIICLGPLITYGTTLTLSANGSIIDFLIGIPFGLLITCCLIVNEYPDSLSDKLSGKNNLAVILGHKYIFILIALIYCLVFIFNLLVMCRINNIYYLMIILIPYFLSAIKTIKNIKYETKKACEKTIKAYFFYSFFLIILTLTINFI